MLENITVDNVQRFDDYYFGERVTQETQTRGARVAVSWENEGCRFHFWYFPETDYLEDDTIYKNPPLGTKRNDGAYFETRRLDAKAKRNAEIVREVLRVARGMIAGAIEAARAI